MYILMRLWVIWGFLLKCQFTTNSVYQQQTNAIGVTTRIFLFWNLALVRKSKRSSWFGIPLSGWIEYRRWRVVGKQYPWFFIDSARTRVQPVWNYPAKKGRWEFKIAKWMSESGERTTQVFERELGVDTTFGRFWKL